jgi:hypothetical protein
MRNKIKSLAWKEEHVNVNLGDAPKVYHHHHTPIGNAIIDPKNYSAMSIHFNNLTHVLPKKDHFSSIMNYKENSKRINTPLRTGGDINSNVPNLIDVTSNKFVAPQFSWRGNDFTGFIPVGESFTDKGFTGTSLLHNRAVNFGRRNQLFAIHAPVGAKAHYIDSYGGPNSEEKELLYHPSTHFEVIGHTSHPRFWDHDNHEITHLAVIGQGKSPEDYTNLINSSEGQNWLAHVKSNHAKIVSGETS